MFPMKITNLMDAPSFTQNDFTELTRLVDYIAANVGDNSEIRY